MVNFSERLKAERNRLGFTQEQFGEKVGVSKKTQVLYEKGDRQPGVEYLMAAEQLGVDVGYLLSGKVSLNISDQSEWDRATYGMSRYERADSIIAEYESAHHFKLPEPWRFSVSKLLLNGLSDPDLHLIFITLMRVEYEAGRLEERQVDYKALAGEK